MDLIHDRLITLEAVESEVYDIQKKMSSLDGIDRRIDRIESLVAQLASKFDS